MKNRDVNRMTKALGLRRKIIGVRFLYFKHEYDKLSVEEYGRKTSYCMMVKHAMEDNCFKAKLENFGCRCALEALGLDEEMECVESGQRYYSLNLYESRAVAKDVTKDISRIKQKIYGVQLGPLEQLEDADVAIFMVNAYQLINLLSDCFAECFSKLIRAGSRFGTTFDSGKSFDGVFHFHSFYKA